RSGDTCQSWVETARGRLYHLAHVESGKVTDYAICAPTEWNFHPDGVAKQLLNELRSRFPTASAEKSTRHCALK
ncbi:hypothetical protein, partial [Thiomicrorhabdus sp.]|uniref:hypothetical protein n=1 Tax=Thiomicrorhabdus sp. TaxID=2039724 RepID=UPI0029C6080F